jgi:hypothetical protein
LRSRERDVGDDAALVKAAEARLGSYLDRLVLMYDNLSVAVQVAFASLGDAGGSARARAAPLLPSPTRFHA